jgi:hypothetical protein
MVMDHSVALSETDTLQMATPQALPIEQNNVQGIKTDHMEASADPEIENCDSQCGFDHPDSTTNPLSASPSLDDGWETDPGSPQASEDEMILQDVSAIYCDVCRELIAHFAMIISSYDGLIREKGEGSHHKTMKNLAVAAAAGCGICSRIMKNYIPSLRHPTHTPTKQRGDFLSYEVIMNSLGAFFRINADPATYGDSHPFTLTAAILLPWNNAAWLETKNLKYESTGETQVLERANRWLNTCLREHPECAENFDASYRPPRLLQLQANAFNLIEADDGTAAVPYATLSYCWGRNPRHLRLTAENRELLAHGLPIESLSRTFQDAIKATQHLGIDHLWIDSLCILQSGDGHEKDWQRHVSEMRLVYMNCTLNLAAEHGEDAEVGCFVIRDPDSIKPCLVNLGVSMAETCPKGYFESFKYTDTMLFDELSYYDAVDNPLMGRGWVIQEKMLSRRVVRFGNEQLSWKCAKNHASETYPLGLPSATADRGIEVYSPRSCLDFISTEWNWSEIVEKYSATSLTKTKDMLPAIAGVVERVCQNRKTSYIAGLLEDQLPVALLWCRLEPDVEYLRALTMADPYRAPTWSWASREGRIWYALHADDFKPEDVLCSIQSIICEYTDPENVYGEVRDGLMIIDTVVFDFARVEEGPGKCSEYQGYVSESTKQRLVGLSKDWYNSYWYLIFDEGYLFTSRAIGTAACLIICDDAEVRNSTHELRCLLLEPAPNADNKTRWRRIGVATSPLLTDNDLSIIRNHPKSTLELV